MLSAKTIFVMSEERRIEETIIDDEGFEIVLSPTENLSQGNDNKYKFIC